MDEIAKAAGEVAKATPKVLAFFEKIGVTGLASEGLGILTDRVKLYRWERLLKLVDRAERVIERRRLQGKRKIQPRFLIPLLDEASLLEDEEDLREMWANLLVTAADSGRPVPKMAYISILKTFDPLEARILAFLCGQLGDHTPSERSFTQDEVKRQFDEGGEVRGAVELALRNLARAQCVEARIFVENRFGEIQSNQVVGLREFVLTPLGVALHRACT